MRDPAVNGGARSRRFNPAMRLLMLVVAALLLAAALQRLWPDAVPAPAPDARAVVAYGPADYAAAIELLDRDLQRENARVAADPGQWMPLEGQAMVLHARGQLTGAHADLAEAAAAADRARALAPDGSGPVLARAIVSLSLHRNAIAAAEVARIDGFAIEPAPGDRAEAEAIRGDLALYRGDYREALAHYRSADGLKRSAGTLIRLSDWHRHRAEFAPARVLLETGLANAGGNAPWMRAVYLLQLGALELQAGDWEQAEARFRDANRAFPGWWLAQAHLAQMEAVRGDFASAERRYRVAMQGAERPAVMEALAALYREQNRVAEAEALEAQAGTIWRKWVSDWPEAYADHAFEAALRTGDTAEAHRLARLNYLARPYGDPRSGLARAAAARGRLASARGILEELERTGWRSVEQYVTLAEVCAKLNDAVCARDARDKALAISPRAFDPRSGLLAFGNH